MTLLILASLQVEVNDKLQKYHHHLVKVPYDAKVTLKCVSPTAKLLTFVNTVNGVEALTSLSHPAGGEKLS